MSQAQLKIDSVDFTTTLGSRGPSLTKAWEATIHGMPVTALPPSPAPDM